MSTGLRSLLYLLTALGCVNGIHYGTTTKSVNSWVFLSRFCFVETPPDSVPATKEYGSLTYTVRMYPQDHISLFLYFRGWNEWEDIYDSGRSCKELSHAADDVIPVWDFADPDDGSGSRVTVTNVYSPPPMENQYVFVAAANCNLTCSETETFCQGPIDIDWELSFTNGDSIMDKHFSCDQQGILEIDISFFVFQTSACILALLIRYVLKVKKKYHHTVKMFIASIFFQYFADIGSMIYYSRIGQEGQVVTGWLIFSDLMSGFATTLLLLMLIVVAKGWTIVRRKISVPGRIKIAVFITSYLFLYVASLSWKFSKLDDAEVIYIYDSTPGIILIGMRSFSTAWFVFAAFTTIRNYDSKKRFYRKFIVLFSVWIWSLPFGAAVVEGMPAWKRQKAIHGWERTTTFFAHIALLLLYNPSSRFNRSFPFHANTSAMLGLGAKIQQQAATPTRAANVTTNEVASRAGAAGEEQTNATAGVTVGALSGVSLGRVTGIARSIQNRMRTLQHYSDDLNHALDDINKTTTSPNPNTSSPRPPGGGDEGLRERRGRGTGGGGGGGGRRW